MTSSVAFGPSLVMMIAATFVLAGNAALTLAY